ncbi:MAG: lipoyl(octanoyl) transferase LipB [Phycisphaerae bacterium]|jgi:lipoate-protein ligase B
MARLLYIDRGRENYSGTLALQQRLVDQVIQAASAPAPQDLAYLVLVEHDPPVITLGRSADAAHVLASPETVAAEGIEVHSASRGGDVTYHGLGQLVAYPILRVDLHCAGVREYLRMLEEVVIGVLAELGIPGRRESGYTGVWVGDEKVAAIGVAVRRWVSYHGLALNVQPNLSHFGLIVPCGIADKRVTSISRLLGRDLDVTQIKPLLIQSMVRVFGFESDEAIGID